MRKAYGELLGRINRRMSTVCVVGLGYVGVPVLRAFRDAKFPVVGYDTNEDRALRVKGENSIPCYWDHCPNAEIYIVCVPTPVNGTTPDLSCVQAVADALPKDCMVVLESTVGPGDTERVFTKQPFVAFSPEREDPGTGRDLVSIPKILAANDYETQLLITSLYSRVFKGLLHMAPSIKTAEMAKLMENTYRAVNIALAVEFHEACQVFGVDSRDATRAAATKPFGYQPFYSGVGVGGHCIPVDPYYLLHNVRQSADDYEPNLTIVRTAMSVNAQSPYRVATAISRDRKSNDRLLVIGATYKKNIDDVRNSPAVTLIECLASGLKVTWYDEHAPQKFAIKGATRAYALTREALFDYDAVVVAVNHDDFDYVLLHGHPCIYDLTGHLPKESNIRRI